MLFGNRRTYLDWAAAAPVSFSALRAFSRAVAVSGNPSSAHAEGRAAKDLLEDARARIARLAGVKQDGVIFTAGATEANALGIVGHVRARLGEGALHVLYLPSAHASVLGAMRTLESLGVTTEPLQVTDGALDLAKLETQLRPETALVVMDLVCGETGVVYKVRDVRRVIDRSGLPVRLFVDASQAPRVESFELTHLGAAMVSLDAQKVGGVRGIGALIAPRFVPLLPLIEGGGQERGLRPGTESPALAAAFAAALEECKEGRAAFIEHAATLRRELLERIGEIPNLTVHESRQQASHIVNISLVGRDTDYLLALLDAAGFAVSTKSACETDEPGSRAVRMLTGDEGQALSTLRISFGPSTKVTEIRRFADALISSVRFMDENAI